MNLFLNLKKLNSIERRTLILNFAQTATMISFAFGVPFVIGLNNYGFYAACFAVPATLSILAQSFFIFLSTSGDENLIEKYFFFFLIVFGLLILVGYSFFLGNYAGILSVVIFGALLSRIFFEVILHARNKEIYVNTLFKVEIIVGALSVLTLFISWKYKIENPYVPVVLLVFGSVILFCFLLINSGIYNVFNFSFRQKKLSKIKIFKGFTLRVYEESFVTNMPLVISIFASNEVAGQFRLALSFAKAMTKFLPYRFELIMYSLSDGTLDKSRVLKVWMNISLFYLVISTISMLLNEIYKLYDLSAAFVVMILFSPVVSFLLIFMPVATKLRPKILWLIIILFFITALSTLSMSVNVMILTFVVAQVVLNAAIFNIVFKNAIVTEK